jgi:ATP-dependent DNA helicase RecQ
VEAYLQESGRAGRDGRQSRAVLLWGPDDERSLQRTKSGAERKRLAALLYYARDTSRCRRKALLELLHYEGDNDNPESSCCDVCEKQAGADLREEASLRDFFRRNKRAYTLDEAVRVLARAENVRWSAEDAERSVIHLIKTGKLKKLNSFFWKNKITVPK